MSSLQDSDEEENGFKTITLLFLLRVSILEANKTTVSLADLVNQVLREEESGVVQKESLLQIADFYTTHSLREINQEHANYQAHDLLCRYRLYKLIATNRFVAQFNIDRERKKPYRVRCSRCCLAIANKVLSLHKCKANK